MPSPLLPAETGLGPVTLIVANLEEERRFYQGVLGMTILSDEGDTVSLGAPRRTGGVTPLVTLVERRDAPHRPHGAPGLYHMALLMPSRAALARVMRHLSATRYRLQGAADHLVSEALYLADPQGNGIEIYADTPRERWQREGTPSAWPPRRWTCAASSPRRTASRGVAGSSRREPHGPHPPEGPRPRGDGALLPGDPRLDPNGPLRRSGALFSAGGYHHHVGANTWESRGAGPAPEGALGLGHYTLVVPAAGDQRAVEARAGRAKEETAWDPEGLWLRDPSGNRLCIMEAATLEQASGDAPGAFREDAAGI